MMVLWFRFEHLPTATLYFLPVIVSVCLYMRHQYQIIRTNKASQLKDGTDKSVSNEEVSEHGSFKAFNCRKNCCAFPPTQRCVLVWMVSTVLIVMLLIITMMIGIAVESANMGKVRSSTLDYFVLDSVCALDISTGVYSTFANRSLALAANQTIAHCGPCGECSNGNDIDVYHETAQSLTWNATQCAAKILTGGR